MKTYDIIVCDPPWKFSSNSVDKPGRNAMRHYRCMSDQELIALPMRDVAADPALLLLWTTSPMLVRSLNVVEAWGFKYVSEIVWVKSRIGTGFWVRNRHEKVLVCKRGRFPWPGKAPFADSVIEAPTRQHSRKPEALQDQIDAAWPHARKLEMFARRERPGWDVWGNQTSKFNAA